MSDIGTDYLSEYINNAPVKKNKSPYLDEYIESQSRTIVDYLSYEDEELNNFMHSPLIHNKLQVSADYEKDRDQYATTFLMAKKFNLPIGKVFENYDQYARSFFGDENPISNAQAYKDSFTKTWTHLKASTLEERLRTFDYENEEEKAQIEDRIRLLNYGLPPEDNVKRFTPNQMLQGAFGQTANWAAILLGMTPIKDITEGVEEAEYKEGNTFFGGLRIRRFYTRDGSCKCYRNTERNDS